MKGRKVEHFIQPAIQVNVLFFLAVLSLTGVTHRLLVEANPMADDLPPPPAHDERRPESRPPPHDEIVAAPNAAPVQNPGPEKPCDGPEEL